MATDGQITILVDYQDSYVEPLILDALRRKLPTAKVTFLQPGSPLSSNANVLQWRSYESIDFVHALSGHGPTSAHIINAYVIRKALIRKHYLAHTVLAHVTKHPASILKKAFPTTVDFELDYAEFLDEALLEAFELQESFQKNDGKLSGEREWWILKPSMSDRGQGIRLFSTEQELSRVFEAWEAEMPDSDDDNEREDADHDSAANVPQKLTEGIMTSHLRHFIAQRYIDKPLLLPQDPFKNRKFHIRTYVVSAGALKLFVYDKMLALFARETFVSPGQNQSEGGDSQDTGEDEELLARMRNVHLTNTCVQSAQDQNESANFVYLLSNLPLTPQQHQSIQEQINNITAEMFRAALAHPTNFQPLPQAFEIFGVDFMCSRDGSLAEDGGLAVHLLEVNAFPDFAQTGKDLKDTVIRGLFDETVQNVIIPMLGSKAFAAETDNRPTIDDDESQETVSYGRLRSVLEVDAGRR